MSRLKIVALRGYLGANFRRIIVGKSKIGFFVGFAFGVGSSTLLH